MAVVGLHPDFEALHNCSVLFNVVKQVLTTVAGILTIGVLIAFISAVTFLAPLGSENSGLPYRTVDEDLPVDIEAALERVEDASISIYSGLETTQEFIGKTEARKRAIEEGRGEASRKLAALVDRVRESIDKGEPLSRTDQKVLLQLQAESESDSRALEAM